MDFNKLLKVASIFVRQAQSSGASPAEDRLGMILGNQAKIAFDEFDLLNKVQETTSKYNDQISASGGNDFILEVPSFDYMQATAKNLGGKWSVSVKITPPVQAKPVIAQILSKYEKFLGDRVAFYMTDPENAAYFSQVPAGATITKTERVTGLTA